MNLEGQVVGQYIIEEQIGEGGMATVFRAYDSNLDRHVAIKVLPTQLASRADFKERFIREAKTVARLDHPNILPIYDAGFEGDLTYFVMKYVSGHQTLQDIMARPISLKTVSELIDQIAAALDHSHDKGVIHRDIKPTNVLIEEGWLLLADFGLAKYGLDSKNLTGVGTVIGTPNYLSPEQAQGETIDHHADIYSLGVVLYEMVLGQVPYDADTPWGIVYKHINDPVPRPRRLRPELAPEIETIILKALDKDPLKRFNRAGDMADALRNQANPSTSTIIITGRTLSEDGGAVVRADTLHPPLPEFDSSLIEVLDAPGGVIKLRDNFYIERQGDEQLRRQIIRPGTTTTIRASRQTGKSSMLVRGINYARQHNTKVVHLDLQRLDGERLATSDLFLRDLAQFIVRKLRLDLAEVDKFWSGSLGPQDKLTYLLEDYVLPEIDDPIILALDEVDRLLHTPFHNDFFALLRSWHNSRALDEQWDKLDLVLVISTEPYLLIADANQSPFNVGLKISLEDFNEEQVQDLNQRHGSPVTEKEFPQLMELLSGQPYLTRQALYMLTIGQFTWNELLEKAALDHGPFGDHLRRQQWLLRDDPELRETFKQIIDQGQSQNEMARFRLLQAGLIKGSGDIFTCRCGLYKKYFADKLI